MADENESRIMAYVGEAARVDWSKTDTIEPSATLIGRRRASRAHHAASSARLGEERLIIMPGWLIYRSLFRQRNAAAQKTNRSTVHFAGYDCVRRLHQLTYTVGLFSFRV